ncbi:YobI family P-loop NTPase [Orbus mooreae]|uniref:YobI family P-loop NTPase n=1 Tax=Orbus mooreae TaxID=3074107 RepID=UPI00370D8A09
MENSPKGSEQVAQEPQDKLTFEKLTPTHLTDEEMKGYTEALDFVFKEDDLLNIAITGPYASGKSSVIKTYEENRKKVGKQFNGIHISLSYFSPTLESKIKGKKKDDELAFEDELMLERKIINQLIHQINPEKIPATEFKVTSESKRWVNIIWAAIISLVICCFIFINKTWLTKLQSENNPMALLLMFSFLCLITFIIYKIINLQNGKNLISKLKIFENEIDISTSSCDVSYFDKYLNEIIYILDKSELNYIVFEDIDRYDDNLILNKLRELNYTYNKKQTKKKPKPIKFLYLIKDEIFESKERTKFFDYILPIIPVMDNSNSLGKMREIFEGRNISSDFSETFLNTLSLYLDDIRLIKNICNEYLIYKNKLAHDISWFNKEKLLAIIVYKNIFPADFSLTRLGLGHGV